MAKTGAQQAQVVTATKYHPTPTGAPPKANFAQGQTTGTASCSSWCLSVEALFQICAALYERSDEIGRLLPQAILKCLSGKCKMTKCI